MNIKVTSNKNMFKNIIPLFVSFTLIGSTNLLSEREIILKEEMYIFKSGGK